MRIRQNGGEECSNPAALRKHRTFVLKVWLMRPHVFVVFALALTTLHLHCRSSRQTSALSPGEQYEALPSEIPTSSIIVVPITLSVRDLAYALNQRVQGLIYEDNSFTDHGNDGLMLRLWRTKPFTIEVLSQTVRYRVPLKIWLKQQIPFGAAEAEGELQVALKTNFSLQPNWSLHTQTTLEFYEWLSTPKLKTALGDINIQPIANLMIAQSRSTLTQMLDRFLSQELGLRQYAQMAWEALQKPVLLDSVHQLWVKATPVSIGVTPLRVVGEELRITLVVEAYTEAKLGQQPVFRSNSSLPNFIFIDEVAEGFQLRLTTEVPFAEAERIGQKLIVGQSFSAGKRQVMVQNLRLWGNGDRLVANTTLRGAVNGDIYLIGKPVFNPSKNCIEVAELEFHAATRNFLHRTAAWLFSSAFKRRLSESLVFPLEENLQAVKTSAQQTLQHYVIQPGVVLKGLLDTLSVERTLVTPRGIRADLYVKGRLQLNVSGL
ncbi:MAG: DUF4403 family protein [Saprospiraceae bacterium]|nr:DUF4403 family protein [Saprospiraceae bacterium]MDW8482941.1 DUF4403 family protein [Saprospiraceae bacterium]